MPFDKALMGLRERMGSMKLLLKQREIVEAFTSVRDAFVSLLGSYSNAFPHHRYCFSELQIWLEW